jgi:hypothetical protein
MCLHANFLRERPPEEVHILYEKNVEKGSSQITNYNVLQVLPEIMWCYWYQFENFHETVNSL